MTASWFSLNRKLSPVQASVKLMGELQAAGRQNIVNLGQGAETERPEGELRELLRYSAEFDPGYNKQIGGEAKLKEVTGAWAERFLGIKGSNFLTQVNGRDGLWRAMQIAGDEAIEQGDKPVMLVPDTAWPMVQSIARKNHLKIVPYKMSKDDFAGAIHKAIEKHYAANPDQPVVAVYTNGRHNPTGAQMSAQEMQKMMDYLAKRVEIDGRAILHIADHPYFHACRQQGGLPYLDNGYQGVLTPDSKTPWISLVSFSKALGTARSGLSITIARPDMEDQVRAYLTETTGVSFAPEFYDQVVKILSQENDVPVLRHFAHLREKYSENRHQVRQLSKVLPLVDGDPNMTCLLEVPDRLLGRSVVCHDGETRTINDVNDLVEYVANETGVIIVNNSTQDRNYVRFALAEANAEKFDGAMASIRRSLLKLAPLPAPGADSAPGQGRELHGE